MDSWPASGKRSRNHWVIDLTTMVNGRGDTDENHTESISCERCAAAAADVVVDDEDEDATELEGLFKAIYYWRERIP